MAELSAHYLRRSSGESRLPRLVFWASRGSLAIVDQALNSASNFGVGIFLARKLLPQEYGSYALSFAIFLLLSLAYQAVLLEPQRVFGSTEHGDSQPEYLSVLLRIHSGLAVTAFLILGLVSFLMYIFRSDGMSRALAGVAIAAPCILLLWLVRNAFYVRMAPQQAVLGSATYCLVLLAGIGLVSKLGLLSSFSAFVVMAAAALAASGVLLFRFGLPTRRAATSLSWKYISAQHWEYGRWIVVSSVFSWMTGDVYYFLVSSFSGITAAAGLRVLLNFSLPIAQALNALSMFAVPHAARVFQDEGVPGLSSAVWKISGVFAGVAAGYWMLVIILARPMMHLLYGDRYTPLAVFLPLIAAASLPWNVAYVPTMAFRAVRSSISLLRIYLISSAVSVVIGFPAAKMFGLRGALWAMVGSNTAAALVSFVLLERKLRDLSQAEQVA